MSDKEIDLLARQVWDDVMPTDYKGAVAYARLLLAAWQKSVEMTNGAKLEPVAWSTGIEWQKCQSETVQKLTKKSQPEHGFTVPLYAAPPSQDGQEPVANPERIAQLIAHRACCGVEHDPMNGKLHGYCVVCGVPWPCSYAGSPPIAPTAAQSDGEVVKVSRDDLIWMSEYWNGDRNDNAMYDALYNILEKVNELLAASKNEETP